jgi:hypothetical protein
VHLEDGGLDDVVAEEAVFVEEIGDGSVKRRLAHFPGLSVANGQNQVVHVVESGNKAPILNLFGPIFQNLCSLIDEKKSLKTGMILRKKVLHQGQASMQLKALPGSAKANGKEPKSCLC